MTLSPVQEKFELAVEASPCGSDVTIREHAEQEPGSWREAHQQIQSEVKHLKLCLDAEVDARKNAIADLVRPPSLTQEDTEQPIANKDAKPSGATIESRMRLVEEQVQFVNALATNLEKIIVESVQRVVEEVKKNSLWVEQTCEKQSTDLQELRNTVSNDSQLWSRLDGDLQKLVEVVRNIAPEPLAEQNKESRIVFDPHKASSQQSMSRTSSTSEAFFPLFSPTTCSESSGSIRAPVPVPIRRSNSASSTLRPKISVAKILGRSISCPPDSASIETVAFDASSRDIAQGTSVSYSPATAAREIVRCRSASPAPVTASKLQTPRGPPIPRRARTQFETLPRLISGIEWKGEQTTEVLCKEWDDSALRRTSSPSRETFTVYDGRTKRDPAIATVLNAQPSVQLPRTNVISSSTDLLIGSSLQDGFDAGDWVITLGNIRSDSVTDAELPAGVYGKVSAVDGDGDICIDFAGLDRMVRIQKSSFGSLKKMLKAGSDVTEPLFSNTPSLVPSQVLSTSPSSAQQPLLSQTPSVVSSSAATPSQPPPMLSHTWSPCMEKATASRSLIFNGIGSGSDTMASSRPAMTPRAQINGANCKMPPRAQATIQRLCSIGSSTSAKVASATAQRYASPLASPSAVQRLASPSAVQRLMSPVTPRPTTSPRGQRAGLLEGYSPSITHRVAMQRWSSQSLSAPLGRI